MSSEQTKKGYLIAFEGIDGTGKSTQVTLLAQFLRQQGLDVVITREPTNGIYGQRIRQLYQARDTVSRQQELELFLADRREHVAGVIAPALALGKVIVTDRYYFSTAAYQGAAGFDPESILLQNEAFAPVPDLVILLELQPEQAVIRIQHYRQETLNHFEQEEGLRQVAKVFSTLQRDCIHRIDASLAVDALHSQIVALVKAKLTLS